MPPFLHVGQPGLDEASSRVSKTLEAAESSMSDLGMMNKATSDSGTQLRHAQSAPLRLQGFEAEEYYVRNLHSKGGEMMERVARKFHLLHSLQAQALLDELRLDKQLIAARRSGTAHFIERRSVLHHVVHLARRANKEYVAFTRTLSGPLRLESCPCEIEKYYVQDFHNENMKKRIARKFHLLHSKQMELANFMNIAELVSPKSRLG